MKSLRPLYAAALAAATLTSPPVVATTFTDGEFYSFSQNTWGADPGAGPPASLVRDHFDSLYPLGMTLGLASGNFMLFTSGQTDNPLLIYLPATGPAAPLNATLVDPTSTSSGIFGGQVAGLRLNIDFNAAGILPHPAGVPFGDLMLTGLSGSLAGLDGMSLSQFQTVANTLLGGGFEPFPLLDVSALTMLINGAFEGGFAGTWADDHLVIAATPTPTVPEPSAEALLLVGVFGMAALATRRAERRRQERTGSRP